MRVNTRFREAFLEVKRSFPIVDYIDESVWHELETILNTLRKFLPDFENKRLLDIGCGPMDKTAMFQTLGFQCYAVDDLNDPWHKRYDNISKIKKYAKDLSINFFHQQQGDYTIPFEGGSFDVVCSLAVIEHLHESPRRLLNAMGAYAKDDGLLVIVMPNSVNLRKRLSVLSGRTNYVPVDQFFYSVGSWRGHVREYSLQETAYICREMGFEILSKTTFEHLAHTKLKFPLRELYITLGNIMPTLRSGVLVACRKPKSWMHVEENLDMFNRALARSVPKGIAVKPL